MYRNRLNQMQSAASRLLCRFTFPRLFAVAFIGAIVNATFVASGRPGPGEWLLYQPGLLVFVTYCAALLVSASVWDFDFGVRTSTKTNNYSVLVPISDKEHEAQVIQRRNSDQMR